MGAPEVEDAAAGGEGVVLNAASGASVPHGWFRLPNAFLQLLHLSYMLPGVHVDPTAGGTGTLEGAGGVSHGMLVKSKKSKRFGCALSRLVRWAVGLMKRLSTNLMTAVWSMGTCET